MRSSDDEEASDRNICIIWFITITFFLVVLIGGILLILYVILPGSATTSWFPVVGMALICIPWTFWIIMCMYRYFVVHCSSWNVSNRITGNSRAAAVVPAGGVSPEGSDRNGAEMVDSPGGGRRVRFGNEATDAHGEGNRAGVMTSEDSSSASHESEKPLTSSSWPTL